jgi:uncharacterized protein (TIGR02246 family)
MPIGQSYEPAAKTDDITISYAENQIRELVQDAMDAWNRHDVSSFIRTYAQDADLTTVVGTSVRGPEAIRDHHTQIFETIFKKSHITAGEIKVRFLNSDIASVDVRWEMTGALEWDGKVIPIRRGLLNWIVTRHGDRWLVTVMHNQEFTPLKY